MSKTSRSIEEEIQVYGSDMAGENRVGLYLVYESTAVCLGILADSLPRSTGAS